MTELKRKVTLKRKIEDSPKPSGKKYFLILIIIVAIVIIVVGGYFLLNKDNSADEKLANTENIQGKSNEEINQEKETYSITDTNKLIPETDTVASKSSTTMASNQDANKQSDDQKSVKQDNGSKKQVSKKVAAQIPYKTGNIYKVYQFPFGVSDYSQSNSELDKLVDVMLKNPDFKIFISAYTDNVGSSEYNQALSEKRAKSIRDYIVSKGIDANRVSFEGKGISTKYTTAEENRRAEFVIS